MNRRVGHAHRVAAMCFAVPLTFRDANRKCVIL
jgi:hypothetical protein